jgi:hypothetical protein
VTKPITVENHFPWYADPTDTTNIDCQCGHPCDGMAEWATHTAKETTVSFIEAAQQFITEIGGNHLATDLADKLSCDEVEALAGLLAALGATAAAATWIEQHAHGDECDDMHCRCDNCGGDQ